MSSVTDTFPNLCMPNTTLLSFRIYHSPRECPWIPASHSRIRLLQQVRLSLLLAETQTPLTGIIKKRTDVRHTLCVGWTIPN